MNKTFLYPYKKGLSSAKELSGVLGVKRIKNEGSAFKPRLDKTIINWGSSNVPIEYDVCTIINSPFTWRYHTRKDVALDVLEAEGVRVPHFTFDMDEAYDWLEEGDKVVARKVLDGSGGEGIVLIEDEEHLIRAPLYTKYVPKVDEYRVHVFPALGTVDVQRKARRLEVPDEDVNWQIRNHDNGFVFARADINPPEDVINQAVLTMEAIHLDFGAVDVVWNDKRQAAYVLEVNIAPGLEGQTLEFYKENMEKLVEIMG